MGTPKALLPMPSAGGSGGGQKTFLEHLLEVTCHHHINFRRVVLGAHAEEVRAQVPLDPACVVVNPDWPRGQLSSIHAALRSLREGTTSGILLCPVDHPLISCALVSTLVEQFHSSGRPIVLPRWEGQRGHPVIFAASLYAELFAAPHDTGARAVVWAHAAEVLEVPTDEEGCVLNLNDPEALKGIRAQAE